MSSGKKSFVCSICHCKHQSARGQQCTQIKQNLPIFTTFLRCHDGSDQTSFARNTDETLESAFAIRRMMAFMHSNTEAFKAWSIANPTAEIGLESSVVPVRPQPQQVAAPTTAPVINIPALNTTFLPEPLSSPERLGLLGNVEFTHSPPPSPIAPKKKTSTQAPVDAAAAGLISFASLAASSASSSNPSSGEKGPAPPCLSYGYLSKAPKITSLNLPPPPPLKKDGDA